MNTVLQIMTDREFQMRLENVLIKIIIDAPNGISSVNSPEQYVLHNHIFAELFICGQGEILLQIDNEYLTLHDGDAVVIPPHTPHTLSHAAPDTTGYTVSLLYIQKGKRDTSGIHQLLQTFFRKDQVPVYRNQPFIFMEIQKIIQSYILNAPDTPRILPAIYITALFMRIAGLPYESVNISTEENVTTFPDNDIQRMMKLDVLITDYYMINWKIEAIAEQLFISSRQLARIVRKRYGKPLKQVIYDRRIQAAERYLLTTNLAISEIATAIGFSSRSVFYHEFAKRHGITPAEYRKNSAAVIGKD